MNTTPQPQPEEQQEPQTITLSPAQRKEISLGVFKEICEITHKVQVISNDLRFSANEIFPGQRQLGQELAPVSVHLSGIINALPFGYQSLVEDKPKEKKEKKAKPEPANDESKSISDKERKARITGEEEKKGG